MEDPIPGEIKIVTPSHTVMDSCDLITQWSVVSGNGVNISTNRTEVAEGNGALQIDIPAGITAIVKLTKASGSWNMAGNTRVIKLWVKSVESNSVPGGYLYFGESDYNEQTSNQMVINNYWHQLRWDIGNIAAGNRDAVSLFGFSLTPGSNRTILIDNVVFASGYSKGKLNDGDAVMSFTPKFYRGSYVGNGGNQTLNIPRAGIPDRIEVSSMAGNNRIPVLWPGYEAGNYSKRLDGFVYDGNGIFNVQEGSFQVGPTDPVNHSGDYYFFHVFWND